MAERKHKTCVDVSGIDQLAGTVWVCGVDCPRPAGPDPDRDARVDAYRDRERRRAARALDRFLEVAVDGADLGPITAVAGERFVEAVGDYVLARLGETDFLGESSHLAVRGCEIHGDACAGDGPGTDWAAWSLHRAHPGDLALPDGFDCPDGCPDTVKHGFTGHHAEHARGVPGMGDWLADPCAGGRCSDPAAHAEGAHDL